jgi:hypothetical protein
LTAFSLHKKFNLKKLHPINMKTFNFALLLALIFGQAAAFVAPATKAAVKATESNTELSYGYGTCLAVTKKKNRVIDASYLVI